MALLNLSNVTKYFADKKVFEDVSFVVEDGHKIGFVGANGSGKTTLFKVICDEMDYNGGEIYKNKGLRIGYVEQFLLKDSNLSVIDELLTIRNDLVDLEKRSNNLDLIIDLRVKYDNLKKGNIDLGYADFRDFCLNSDYKNSIDLSYLEEYKDLSLESLNNCKADVHSKFEENGGYTYKSIARSTLIGLGFEEKELDVSTSILSGGQKTKLTLAKLLFSNSNLLLLDEPTNNLDISSIEWLENFLQNYRGSFIVISHDRYFLDKVTNETMELENHRVSMYAGNYSKYLVLKDEKNKTLSKQYAQTIKEINRIEGVIDQQKRWNQQHNYVTIRSKQHAIDRLEETLVKPDEELEKMKFHFNVVAGGNQDVLVTKNLEKEFENKKLFSNLNMKVLKKDRAFIIGPNGCGKTTFLKIILNKEKQTSGEFLIGSNMKIAHYSQSGDEIESNKTVLDYVWDEHQKLTQTEIRKALAIFLFKGEEVYKIVNTLSGGEKARIALLKIMLSESNFLILDEPTNHLDILAREALEEALKDYEGTLLIVSHDRYFINKLSNKIFKLSKDGVNEIEGNYENYIAYEEARKSEQVNALPVKEKNLSYQEKKAKEAAERKKNNRIKAIEDKINANDEKIKALENDAMNPEISSDYVKVMEINEQIEALKEESDKLMEEYEILI